MALMITGRHLDMRPLTTEDLEKEQDMSGGFEQSFRNGKAREPVTLRHREGS